MRDDATGCLRADIWLQQAKSQLIIILSKFLSTTRSIWSSHAGTARSPQPSWGGAA